MKKSLYKIHLIGCAVSFIVSFSLGCFLEFYLGKESGHSYGAILMWLFAGNEIKYAEVRPKWGVVPMRTFFIGIGKPHIHRKIMIGWYIFFLICFIVLFIKDLIALFS